MINPKNSYYIIRNTQVAKQMRLTLDKSVAAAFGGDIPFSKALQVSGAAKDPPDAAPARGSTQTPANGKTSDSLTTSDDKAADKPASSTPTTNGAKPSQSKADNDSISGSASVSLTPGKQPTFNINVASGQSAPVGVAGPCPQSWRPYRHPSLFYVGGRCFPADTLVF